MQLRKMILFIASGLFLIGLAACGSSDATSIGGPCTYQDYAGSARIVSNATLTQLDPACSNPSNAAKIVFDFTPDDPTAPDRYLFPAYSDNGNYYIIDASCVASSGLTIDSIHTATRREETHGSCPPFYIAVPDIDLSQCAPVCN